MITARSFPFFAAAGLTLAALSLTSAPASAQQAGKNTAAGPLPVTPFGPRAKPPRRTAVQPGAPRPAAPKPETVATHGIWKVQCEKVPAGKDKNGNIIKRKVCYLAATRIDPEKRGVFLAVLLLKAKRKGAKGKVVAAHMFNMRAPIGVYLPTGIGLEVDGKAIARAPFLRCSQAFCESLAQASPKTLTALQKGKTARFIYYAAPGVGLPLTFDLKGFAAAMKTLNDVQK